LAGGSTAGLVVANAEATLEVVVAVRVLRSCRSQSW
jgi:hypothetical protein